MADNYIMPLAPDVAAAVAQLNELDREQFEERAAILEFDAGIPRREAERRALGMVLRQRRSDRAVGHQDGGSAALG